MTGSASVVRVAALQMCCGSDLDANFRVIDELAASASQRGCDLLLLPENSVFIGSGDADKLAHAEAEGNGPIQAFLSAAAKQHGLWLIAGSIPLAGSSPMRCFGASVVFDDQGVQRAIYRKIHLFDVDLPATGESYRESATMQPGEESTVVDSPAGRIGLTICYDLRFPELFRRLTDLGATVFTVPAAFTDTTGRAHWRSLLRARAIENQAWVIAAGQSGVHPNGRRTHGHSMIVDPWGEVLAELPDGTGIVDAVLDDERRLQLRRAFPVLDHRKL